jgi:hypothetical protein
VSPVLIIRTILSGLIDVPNSEVRWPKAYTNREQWSSRGASWEGKSVP